MHVIVGVSAKKLQDPQGMSSSNVIVYGDKSDDTAFMSEHVTFCTSSGIEIMPNVVYIITQMP